MAEFGQFLINNMRSSLEPEDLRILTSRNATVGYRISTKSDNCCSPIKEEDNDADVGVIVGVGENKCLNEEVNKRVNLKVSEAAINAGVGAKRDAEKEQVDAKIVFTKMLMKQLDSKSNNELDGEKSGINYNNNKKSRGNKLVDGEIKSNKCSTSTFGVRTIKWGSYVESWKNLAEKYNSRSTMNELKASGGMMMTTTEKNVKMTIKPDEKCEKMKLVDSEDGNNHVVNVRPESRLLSKALSNANKINVRSSVYKSKKYKSFKSGSSTADEVSSNSQKVTNNPIYIPDTRIR